MKKGHLLSYDGTFKGLLTCVFTAFEQKLVVTAISPGAEIQQDVFSVWEMIFTDIQKATRVEKAIKQILPARAVSQLYYSFLSEQPGIEMIILKYLRSVFSNKNFSSTDYGDETVLKISQTAKKVSREKHRMEAFVRFRLTKDDIFFATIEPDFNVLPLILPHFKTRYADQKWIIYDLRRKFGIYYDLNKVDYVTFDFSEEINTTNPDVSIYAPSEVEFQKLWQQYFKSTNIISRLNLKLHLQHVPKRYWKYLTEKSLLQN